jgi:DHA2 family multidrug resistance protein
MTAPQPKPAAGRAEGFQRAMITLSIMTATVMNSLDSTIANVALPHIQGSLSASQDQISWVLTSYIVASAIATPLTGWVAGRFGRKMVFMVSVGGFTVASALCGVAGSLFEIVAYRLLQGVFGAALIPLAQTVLLDINPPERHGQAMAVWGMGAMLGPIMGPALGGWLTDNFSWRWVFYINVPFGVAAMTGIFLFIHDVPRAQGQKFDFFGFATLALGVGALQMMLDRGQAQDWFSSPEIWIELILAILGFYWCAVNTLTAPAPFVRRRLMRDRNFVSACVFGMVIGLILYATMALLPPMIETLLGYSVTDTGQITMPRGFGTLISMFLVGRLVNRVDPRIIIAIGLCISAFAMFEMTKFSLDMPAGPILVTGFLQGLGMGLLFVPLSLLAFSTVDASLRTEGAGLYTLTRSLGSSIGISILEALLITNERVVQAGMVQHVRPDNPVFHLGGRAYDLANPMVLAQLSGEMARQAAMIAYLDNFKLMMLVCFAAMPLLLLMRRPKRLPQESHLSVE